MQFGETNTFDYLDSSSNFYVLVLVLFKPELSTSPSLQTLAGVPQIFVTPPANAMAWEDIQMLADDRQPASVLLIWR